MCQCADWLRYMPHGHWQISTLANGHIIKKYYETAIFPSKIIHGHEKVNNK